MASVSEIRHHISAVDQTRKITNAMQIFISGIRLDWGLILPNNPFLNMTVMSETLDSSATSLSKREFWSDLFTLVVDAAVAIMNWLETLYEPSWLPDLTNSTNIETYGMDAFMHGNSTYLRAEYECQFRYRVGWGESLPVTVLERQYLMYIVFQCSSGHP